MSDTIKIVLFEKESAFAKDVRMALSSFGYAAPAVVSSAEQLLECAGRDKPDLILGGIPLTGWHDTLEELEAVAVRFSIPLIDLSCHANADLFERSLAATPFAFLLKPFSSIQLIYTIEIALARQRLETCFREKGALCHRVFELNGSAMLVLESGGKILMVNETFEQLSGYARDSIIGRMNWNDFFFDRLSNMAEAEESASHKPHLLIAEGQVSKPVRLNVRRIEQSGHYIASIFAADRLNVSEGGLDVLNSELIKMNDELRRELFERKNYENVLLHQANHDSLTGLPNRQLLFDRLNQAIAYVNRNDTMLALMLVDLDNFKPINDTLGHIAGDAVLKEVAGRLQACLRKYDTVARFGGDEFVLIVNDMPDIHDIVRFADKIFTVFQHPFDVLGKEVSVTASIGLGIYPLQSTSTECLLKMADTAMYQAKNEGGNAYKFFTESMSLKLDRRAVLEGKLKAALDQEEYLAHYQPRIDVATRKIVGMEALMRWQPMDGPLAYPADFFTALEESGMIVPVGEWLLEKICQQNRAWQDAGLPPLRVAMNVSERQFSQDDFADRVANALSSSRLEPRFLEIELPEQIVMNNVVESISRLKKLKSTGVVIALDNFGTGYSSLTHLNRLPIDDIQIDKSLVNCIVSDENDANVVSAIISMGHSLGKNLVAEGVESEGQFMFLAQRNCQEMQGHFFSRPLTSNEFEKMARKYTL